MEDFNLVKKMIWKIQESKSFYYDVLDQILNNMFALGFDNNKGDFNIIVKNVTNDLEV